MTLLLDTLLVSAVCLHSIESPKKLKNSSTTNYQKSEHYFEKQKDFPKFQFFFEDFLNLLCVEGLLVQVVALMDASTSAALLLLLIDSSTPKNFAKSFFLAVCFLEVCKSAEWLKATFWAILTSGTIIKSTSCSFRPEKINWNMVSTT